MGRVSWDTRHILPSCFARHLFRKQGRDAGIGRVKTPGRCWCSGIWIPHPRSLADLLNGHLGSTSEAARPHPANCHPPTPVPCYRVLCVHMGVAGLLWHWPQPHILCRDSCSYRGSMPSGTWHLRGQRHFSQVTAVIQQSLHVHTQCAVCIAVRFFFWFLE